MNYSTTNATQNNGLSIIVKRKKKTFNILLSKKILFLTKDNFELIHHILTEINEESLHGSFYFCDGTLTLQMLLSEKLTEKTLKQKLNIAIASFESITNMLEVITHE